jgi:hypothetical protein
LDVDATCCASATALQLTSAATAQEIMYLAFITRTPFAVGAHT